MSESSVMDKAEEIKKFELTLDDDVRQILYGGILGSTFVCRGKKNDYICMKHSQDHDEWLRTKAAELTQFASKKPFYQHNTTISWRSTCHPYFNYLRTKFYKDDQKVVTMDLLDELRALAIAVWFGDSGCMTGRNNKNACLRTQSLGQSNEVIEKYFNQVGLHCAANKCKDSYIIVFSVEGTRKLFRLILNSLPSPRLMKLLPFNSVEV